MSILKLFLLALIFPMGAYAQHTVSGTVKDASGEALAGVNIVEKGTYRGTTTDRNGDYSLTVTSKHSVLVFSYLGYGKTEARVGDQTTLDVTLSESAIQLGDIQVVGTRSYGRTAIETPVPVDVIDMRDIPNKVGQVEVNQVLQYIAPSFNSNKQSGADGADHIDPATLRGLGPDQTLVLINGKRRHQSSLINIFGSRGRGNTGTDLNAIPVSAIERIEILRDGASAQYGSDAIAGVINVVLKSSVEEFTGSISGGFNKADPGSKYDVALPKDYDWDGETKAISANYGVRLGEGGFANFTADYQTKEKTNRPADPGVFDIYRQQFGDAGGNNFSFFTHAAYPVNQKTSVYAFGGIGHRYTDAYAWTRTADEERNVISIYPNGFNPRITSKIDDRSISAGVRTQLGKWDMDINNTFGSNRFDYTIKNTLNASLEGASPTRFDAGGFQLWQNTTGINFTKFYPAIHKGLNVGVGLEYRIENYEIFAGEEGSWRDYGPVFFGLDGTDSIFRPGGSQGFPGFQPGDEIDKSRSNFGSYLDMELDVTDRWMVGGALRFENYSDFGSTLNGKLAARYKINPNVTLRGSASTGFRAPSLAQIYFNSTFTDFVSGVAVDKLIARNTGQIAKDLGIPKLKEEKATDISGGFAVKYGDFSGSVDGYYVTIKDRIVLTGAFEDTDPDIGAQLQALNVGAAQFFTNALDTRTFGIDVVISHTAFMGEQRLITTFAGNYNKMADIKAKDIHTTPQLAGKEDIYFGSREQRFLLASAPESKFNLTFDHKYQKFSSNLQFVYFGRVVLEDWLGTLDKYDGKIVTNLTLGYEVTHHVSVNVGAANLFNVYPKQQDTETETGGLWDAVQMGFSGTYYFSRVNFRF